MTQDKALPSDGMHHYSRDGFVGSGAHATRPNYVPTYTRIDGSYAPRRLALTLQLTLLSLYSIHP